MLSKASVTTMLPVADAERAGRFYTEKLGLNLRATAADGSLIFDVGSGDAIGLLAAEPGAQSAHTVLTFEVADITAEIRELEGRGVVFEDYDLPNLKTVNHIAAFGNERAAWFKDSEGNILCVHEMLPGANK